MRRLVYLDDDKIQHLLMRKLVKIYLPDCSMEFFNEPENLDRWLTENHADLILSDLNFDRSSGWDWVPSFSSKSGAPIVFLTANSSPEDRRRVADFPSVKYVIEKPISEDNWKTLESLM